MTPSECVHLSQLVLTNPSSPSVIFSSCQQNQLVTSLCYTVKQLFNLRKYIYIDVRIKIKLSCLFENIISCERFINKSPTLCHKMAATNKVFNQNNFGIVLVMTSATFNDVHASRQIRETEWCKPLNVYKWIRKLQAELWWKVKDDTNLSRTKTCSMFRITLA